MKNRQQLVFDAGAQFLASKTTRPQAAMLVGRRERTVSRLARRIEAKGVLGVVHGNLGRIAHNRKSEELKDQAVRLMQLRYFDVNLPHALAKLKDRRAIVVSHETLRRWCHEKGLVNQAKR